jgi:hypothetical protein
VLSRAAVGNRGILKDLLSHDAPHPGWTGPHIPWLPSRPRGFRFQRRISSHFSPPSPHFSRFGAEASPHGRVIAPARDGIEWRKHLVWIARRRSCEPEREILIAMDFWTCVSEIIKTAAPVATAGIAIWAARTRRRTLENQRADELSSCLI